MSLAPSQSVTVALRGQLDWLQPAQRRVAEAILADPVRAVGCSIGQLAEQADTSAATVIRLCRSLGLDGYPELRLALAQEEGRRGELPAPQGDISEGDDLTSVVLKIAEADVMAVRDTAAEIDIATLEAVIDVLVDARRIDIYGVGASAIVAADLAQKLTRIGRHAQAFTDAHIGLTSAALLGPGDVAFAISHSGATDDTLDMMLTAQRTGATVVALTNSAAAPMAKQADHVLLTAATESTFRSGATASRLAQLTVVDCVFVGLAQRTYAASQAALAATRRAISQRATKA